MKKATIFACALASLMMALPGAASTTPDVDEYRSPDQDQPQSVLPATEVAELPSTEVPEKLRSRVNEYSELAGLKPEDAYREMIEYADSSGLDREQFVNDVTSVIYRQPKFGKARPSPSPGERPSIPTRRLPKGRTGDIYYSKLSIPVLENFGHVGLYSSQNKVIESGTALGWPPKAYETDRNRVEVAKSGFKRKYLTLGRGGPRHTAAIHEALLRGRIWAKSARPYNWTPHKNKQPDGKMPGYQFNCSQLVWSAYLPHANLDVDPGNNQIKTDSATWPYELITHTWLRSY